MQCHTVNDKSRVCIARYKGVVQIDMLPPQLEFTRNVSNRRGEFSSQRIKLDPWSGVFLHCLLWRDKIYCPESLSRRTTIAQSFGTTTASGGHQSRHVFTRSTTGTGTDSSSKLRHCNWWKRLSWVLEVREVTQRIAVQRISDQLLHLNRHVFRNIRWH